MLIGRIMLDIIFMPWQMAVTIDLQVAVGMAANILIGTIVAFSCYMEGIRLTRLHRTGISHRVFGGLDACGLWEMGPAGVCLYIVHYIAAGGKVIGLSAGTMGSKADPVSTKTHPGSPVSPPRLSQRSQ